MSDTAYSKNLPCRLNRISRWDQEADVVVVGFGAAGACAALEAARAGAKVVLFEVGAGSGGTSALSGGEIYAGGSGGTPMQRSAGFTDDTEDLYRYLLLAGGPNADEAKVRLYADHSLAHFEWLQAQGIKYKNSFIPQRIVEPTTDDCLIWSGSEEAWPFYEQAKSCPRGHTPQWLGMGGGRYLMDVLAQPGEKPAIVTPANLVLKLVPAVIGFRQLGRIEAPQRVAREIAEHAQRPVNVLQHAVTVARWPDPDQGGAALVPRGRQVRHPQIAGEER